ncbi:hypothetical protein K439DRAFT_1624582 [Ramaria rubella]|nr:hypothetical protein K439DRAFT_1624582 [Ramaria rubella]
MIVDQKSSGSSSKTPSLPTMAIASTSERKLSVELPTPKQIYTVGSTVSGIIHLGTKEQELIQEVQVSLICAVRSVHHRSYSGSAHDIRRETTNLVHRDQTLWTRADADGSPPEDFVFQITIPEIGNDIKSNSHDTSLPPSFHAGKHSGWKNILTYGTPIGFVRYHIKASVIRKGAFKRKERQVLCYFTPSSLKPLCNRAFKPFIFLPPSPPPPLLPNPLEIVSENDLESLSDVWTSNRALSNIRNAVFSSNAQATLALWLPRVPSFDRLTPIPFFLCLTLQTRRVSPKETTDADSPDEVLYPPVQIDRASMHLRQYIRICARRGVQHHTKTFDKPMDNILHGVTPQEGAWALKKDGLDIYWEKGYIWRGLWTFKETPNFSNRQLAWKYALVVEVPIKGLGNGVKLVSRDVEVQSGIATGIGVITALDDTFGLPPDYFDSERMSGDDEDEVGSEGEEGNIRRDKGSN